MVYSFQSNLELREHAEQDFFSFIHLGLDKM